VGKLGWNVDRGRRFDLEARAVDDHLREQTGQMPLGADEKKGAINLVCVFLDVSRATSRNDRRCRR
jgi:hypothetical protein